MATTADFRNGLCIEYNNDLYIITEFQHVKPGKGPAFVRTKLKNIKSGKVLDNTFTAGASVNTARIERRSQQFLYKEGEFFTFMDTETFEQVTIDPHLIEKPGLMKEGQEVDILFHAETETPLLVELPPFVVMQVTYTEPAVKGNTSTNATKYATLETGFEIKVPLFIEQDEVIKVDTRDNSYAERVK